jgi:glucitol operon activator protein
MSTTQSFLLIVAAVLLTATSGLAQHKYYTRTVRRLAREHNAPGCVLVSGRGKSRFRGAIAVLVLRRDDEKIQAAAVMEGASVLARFKDRPDWVGLSARSPLPRCSPRLVAAVADARSHAPDLHRSAQGQAMRSVAPEHGDRNVKANP